MQTNTVDLTGKNSKTCDNYSVLHGCLYLGGNNNITI